MSKAKTIKADFRVKAVLGFFEHFSNASGRIWGDIRVSRFSLKEQVFFAKRLSFLMNAGVTVVEGLSILREQAFSKGQARVLDQVLIDVTNGQTLAKSFAKFPKVFSDFAVHIIKVGESSGTLSSNLEYLAEELKKKQLLKKKVLGALVYPIFITVATLGVTAMITAYIFPKLMPIFTSLHVDLPLTTQILIGVSVYLRDWGYVTLLGLIALLTILFVVRNRFEQVRMFGDRTLIRIPLAGSICSSYNLTNFCRTLGLLLRSGLPLTSALQITAETTTNRVYRAACLGMSSYVIRGEPISRGLMKYPHLYPDILTHMISIGEKTGNLSKTLTYLGEMYEDDVEELTKGMSSSIEPVLMVVMGLLVGLIAVSVITPIYSITQHLQPR